MRRAVAAAAALAAAATLAAGQSAAEPVCTVTWDGGAATSRWWEPANWSGDAAPEPDDVVCIPAGVSVLHNAGTNAVGAIRGEGELVVRSGELTIHGGEGSSIGTLSIVDGRLVAEGQLAVGSVSQSGGRLSGGGLLSTRAFTWLGGEQDTDGETRVVAGGAGLTIAGAGHTLNGTRTLRLEAGAAGVWTGGDVELRESTRIVNAGTLDIQGDQDLIGCCAADPAVVNEPGGVIRRSAGGGDLNFSYRLDNDGLLRVESGTVSLRGTPAGATSDGRFAAADGATLRFVAGDNRLGPTSAVASEGSGTLLSTGGTLHLGGAVDARTVVDGGGASVFFDGSASPRRLELRRGFAGGGGTVETPDLVWTGGALTGAGETRVTPGGAGVVVSGADPHELSGRTLSIAAGATARLVSGAVTLSGSARVANQGSLELSDGTRLELCCDTTPLVHNLPGGVVSRSGTGRASIPAPFRNDGTVLANTGTLALGNQVANLDGGTLSGGRWDVLATLELRAPVVHNAAELLLDGPDSRIWDASAGADALRAFAFNDAQGKLTVDSGRRLAAPLAGDFVNSGEVTLRRDSALAAAGRYLQSAGTTTLAQPGSRVSGSAGGADIRGGVLRGIGTVGSDLLNDGEVQPGLSPGTLTVDGDYEQGPDGTLAIEIAGRGEDEHDLLDVAGSASFAGALSVENQPPFAPEPLDEIEIVRHASVTGGFDRVTGLEVDAAHRYGPPDHEPAATWLRSRTLPDLTIGDVTVDEGAGEAVFEVHLSSPSRFRIGFDSRTFDGTATEPDDYPLTRRFVILEPGETSARLAVPIADDALDEPDETFTLQLGEISGANYDDVAATATILDDDQPPLPDPDPVPDPEPDPEPEPEPEPEPDPDPEPEPEPDPEPVPEPAPEPTPEPDPVLELEPVPVSESPPDRGSDPLSVPDSGLGPAPEPAAPVDRATAEQATAQDPPEKALPGPHEATGHHCADDKAPRSSFRPGRRPIAASRLGLSFRGIAWERGCGALDRVTIAIARREGGGTGLCRYLQPDRSLGRIVSCRRPTYVRARGTTVWSFSLRRRLPGGTYTARIRAVDRAGNSEKKVRKASLRSRNFVTLKVR